MASKAEITSQYILDKVAPVFNKHGYTGTTMADITAATGLTKGAVYGNFKNKEDLAIAAFNVNIKRTVNLLVKELEGVESPLQQLFTMTDFYRRYYRLTKDFGGCPILNIGIDANHHHPVLLKRVQSVMNKLQQHIVNMITAGLEVGELKAEIDAVQYAKRIFAMIEGAIFMAVIREDEQHLIDMMDHIDQMINDEMRAK